MHFQVESSHVAFPTLTLELHKSFIRNNFQLYESVIVKLNLKLNISSAFNTDSMLKNRWCLKLIASGLFL